MTLTDWTIAIFAIGIFGYLGMLASTRHAKPWPLIATAVAVIVGMTWGSCSIESIKAACVIRVRAECVLWESPEAKERAE